MLNFNSIKVRLERDIYGKASSVNEFQFHKGTIRTNLLAQLKNAELVFQFHKGTIRTSAFSEKETPDWISIP